MGMNTLPTLMYIYYVSTKDKKKCVDSPGTKVIGEPYCVYTGS